MPPSSWYLSGERLRKYGGTKVRQKILQHFHFQSLSLSLSFEASAQPKMAFLLNKTSIASHFRSHSQVPRTSSLLDPFPSSFHSSNLSLSLSLSLSLEDSGRALSLAPRLPHRTRGSRESRKSLSLFSIALSLYLYCLISVRAYKHAYQIDLDLVELVAETLYQTPKDYYFWYISEF